MPEQLAIALFQILTKSLNKLWTRNFNLKTWHFKLRTPKPKLRTRNVELFAQNMELKTRNIEYFASTGNQGEPEEASPFRGTWKQPEPPTALVRLCLQKR